MSRTLVIQPLPGIGDMLWYLPYLRAIAQKIPSGTLSILTKQSAQVDKTLGHLPFVEECLYLEDLKTGFPLPLLSAIQKLKQRGYETSWTLHHSTRYAFLPWAARIKNRHGYGFKGQRKYLNSGIYLPQKDAQEGPQGRATNFLNLYGLPLSQEDAFLSPNPPALHAIEHRYQDRLNRCVVLGIGASQPFKQWPLDRFAHLAHHLNHHRGKDVFLLCAPAEKPLGETVLKHLGELGSEAHLAADLPLDQAIALISKAEFYVGNCSGPLNIAACLNIPAFGLFGATEPLDHLPSLKTIISPSGQESLKMQGISVNDVLAKISSEK